MYIGYTLTLQSFFIKTDDKLDHDVDLRYTSHFMKCYLGYGMIFCAKSYVHTSPFPYKRHRLNTSTEDRFHFLVELSRIRLPPGRSVRYTLTDRTPWELNSSGMSD